MKKSRSTSTPALLLRWIFRRRDRALTCRLEREPGHAYAVSLVAHWDVTCAAIETFDAGVAALQRHAAIASDLRRGGWTLVADGAARVIAPPRVRLDARSLTDTFPHV